MAGVNGTGCRRRRRSSCGGTFYPTTLISGSILQGEVNFGLGECDIRQFRNAYRFRLRPINSELSSLLNAQAGVSAWISGVISVQCVSVRFGDASGFGEASSSPIESLQFPQVRPSQGCRSTLERPGCLVPPCSAQPPNPKFLVHLERELAVQWTQKAGSCALGAARFRPRCN